MRGRDSAEPMRGTSGDRGQSQDQDTCSNVQDRDGGEAEGLLEGLGAAADGELGVDAAGHAHRRGDAAAAAAAPQSSARADRHALPGAGGAGGAGRGCRRAKVRRAVPDPPPAAGRRWPLRQPGVPLADEDSRRQAARLRRLRPRHPRTARAARPAGGRAGPRRAEGQLQKHLDGGLLQEAGEGDAAGPAGAVPRLRRGRPAAPPRLAAAALLPGRRHVRLRVRAVLHQRRPRGRRPRARRARRPPVLPQPPLHRAGVLRRAGGRARRPRAAARAARRPVRPQGPGQPGVRPARAADGLAGLRRQGQPLGGHRRRPAAGRRSGHLRRAGAGRRPGEGDAGWPCAPSCARPGLGRPRAHRLPRRGCQQSPLLLRLEGRPGEAHAGRGVLLVAVAGHLSSEPLRSLG